VYEESLDISRRLAAKDPSNAQWQRDLSVCLGSVGDVLMAFGDLSAGRAVYEESLDIAKRLAAEDPSNAQWQRDLIRSYVRLGKIAEQRQQRGEAREAYDIALAIAMRQENAGRLSPSDTWMLEEIAGRLRRVQSGDT
jgi:tetratricopeptide (TPR) repeat protein